jgi:hypothetical protein
LRAVAAEMAKLAPWVKFPSFARDGVTNGSPSFCAALQQTKHTSRLDQAQNTTRHSLQPWSVEQYSRT